MAAKRKSLGQRPSKCSLDVHCDDGVIYSVEVTDKDKVKDLQARIMKYRVADPYVTVSHLHERDIESALTTSIRNTRTGAYKLLSDHSYVLSALQSQQDDMVQMFGFLSRQQQSTTERIGDKLKTLISNCEDLNTLRAVEDMFMTVVDKGPPTIEQANGTSSTSLLEPVSFSNSRRKSNSGGSSNIPHVVRGTGNYQSFSNPNTPRIEGARILSDMSQNAIEDHSSRLVSSDHVSDVGDYDQNMDTSQPPIELEQETRPKKKRGRPKKVRSMTQERSASQQSDDSSRGRTPQVVRPMQSSNDGRSRSASKKGKHDALDYDSMIQRTPRTAAAVVLARLAQRSPTRDNSETVSSITAITSDSMSGKDGQSGTPTTVGKRQGPKKRGSTSAIPATSESARSKDSQVGTSSLSVKKKRGRPKKVVTDDAPTGSESAQTDSSRSRPTSATKRSDGAKNSNTVEVNLNPEEKKRRDGLQLKAQKKKELREQQNQIAEQLRAEKRLEREKEMQLIEKEQIQSKKDKQNVNIAKDSSTSRASSPSKSPNGGNLHWKTKAKLDRDAKAEQMKQTIENVGDSAVKRKRGASKGSSSSSSSSSSTSVDSSHSPAATSPAKKLKTKTQKVVKDSATSDSSVASISSSGTEESRSNASELMRGNQQKRKQTSSTEKGLPGGPIAESSTTSTETATNEAQAKKKRGPSRPRQSMSPSSSSPPPNSTAADDVQRSHLGDAADANSSVVRDAGRHHGEETGDAPVAAVDSAPKIGGGDGNRSKTVPAANGVADSRVDALATGERSVTNNNNNNNNAPTTFGTASNTVATAPNVGFVAADVHRSHLGNATDANSSVAVDVRRRHHEEGKEEAPAIAAPKETNQPSARTMDVATSSKDQGGGGSRNTSAKTTPAPAPVPAPSAVPTHQASAATMDQDAANLYFSTFDLWKLPSLAAAKEGAKSANPKRLTESTFVPKEHGAKRNKSPRSDKSPAKSSTTAVVSLAAIMGVSGPPQPPSLFVDESARNNTSGLNSSKTLPESGQSSQNVGTGTKGAVTSTASTVVGNVNEARGSSVSHTTMREAPSVAPPTPSNESSSGNIPRDGGPSKGGERAVARKKRPPPPPQVGATRTTRLQSGSIEPRSALQYYDNYNEGDFLDDKDFEAVLKAQNEDLDEHNRQLDQALESSDGEDGGVSLTSSPSGTNRTNGGSRGRGRPRSRGRSAGKESPNDMSTADAAMAAMSAMEQLENEEGERGPSDGSPAKSAKTSPEKVKAKQKQKERCKEKEKERERDTISAPVSTSTAVPAAPAQDIIAQLKQQLLAKKDKTSKQGEKRHNDQYQSQPQQSQSQSPHSVAGSNGSTVPPVGYASAQSPNGSSTLRELMQVETVNKVKGVVAIIPPKSSTSAVSDEGKVNE